MLKAQVSDTDNTYSVLSHKHIQHENPTLITKHYYINSLPNINNILQRELVQKDLSDSALHCKQVDVI